PRSENVDSPNFHYTHLPTLDAPPAGPAIARTAIAASGRASFLTYPLTQSPFVPRPPRRTPKYELKVKAFLLRRLARGNDGRRDGPRPELQGLTLVVRNR